MTAAARAARALRTTCDGSLVTWAIDPLGTLEEQLRGDLEASGTLQQLSPEVALRRERGGPEA